MGTALLHAGYAVIGTDYTDPACFGDASCVADVKMAAEAARRQFGFKGDPYCVAGSMGGIVALNAIAHGAIHCRAMELLFPIYSLESIYHGNQTELIAQINRDYQVKTPSDYKAATLGYDPALDAPSTFRSTPMDIHCSVADEIVPCTQNGKALAATVSAVGGTATFTPCRGGHGNPSCIVPAAVIEFFREH